MYLHDFDLLHCDPGALARCSIGDLLEAREYFSNMAIIKATIKRMSNNVGAYEVVKSAKRTQRLCEQIVIKLDRALLSRGVEMPSLEL